MAVIVLVLIADVFARIQSNVGQESILCRLKVNGYALLSGCCLDIIICATSELQYILIFTTHRK